MATEYELKKSLPNKMINENNTITDLAGNAVTNTVTEYENKPALPNKWLNPDGTYSTLADILSGMIDTDLFIVVEELPASGNVNKIYLLADGDTLKEYHWTGAKWDPIGMVEFDLSKYSTTEQMNEAIMTALNSAKAYTDEKIADIKVDPQVFYWDGKTDKAGRDFWTNLVEINKTQDVIINFYSNVEIPPNKYPTSIIGKGELYDTLVASGSIRIRFTYQPHIEPKTYASSSLVAIKVFVVKLTSSNLDGIITDIFASDNVSSFERVEVLAIGQNYATPYVPQYPGSPATKKYVDDSIASNITQVLGGEY